jgi:hypothetical protein
LRERFIKWAKWRIEHIDSMDRMVAKDVEAGIIHRFWDSVEEVIEKDGF